MKGNVDETEILMPVFNHSNVSRLYVNLHNSAWYPFIDFDQGYCRGYPF